MWLTPQRPNQEPCGCWAPSRYLIAGASISDPGCPPRPLSISTACAVTSSLGGSSMAPKSANGSEYTTWRTLSRSKAAHAPLRDRIASTQSRARCTAPRTSVVCSASSRASTTTEVSSSAGPGARAHSGPPQREDRERRVPHRRHARLEAPATLVVERKASQPLDPTTHHRVVQRHALEVQRDERIDPRRLDAAPAAIGLLPVADPLDEPVPCRAATGVKAETVVLLLEVVCPREWSARLDASQPPLGARQDQLGERERQ